MALRTHPLVYPLLCLAQGFFLALGLGVAAALGLPVTLRHRLRAPCRLARHQHQPSLLCS